MIERHFEISVGSGEVRPANLEGILFRFGREYERDEAMRRLDNLRSDSAFMDALFSGLGERFKLENSASECPFYRLVLAGTLLVGKTNPTDINRLSQILCGYVVEKEDSISISSPLSGRRGHEYSPNSQCWKVTIELYRLVEFMKEKEELTLISSEIKSEEELRLILNERERVGKNNTSRQMVFAVWSELKPVITSFFNPGKKPHALPDPLKGGKQETTALLVLRPEVFDASSQLNIHSPEYEELTKWTEKQVLRHLLDLVGRRNLGLYLGDEELSLAMEDTAENCPKKPEQFFFGQLSIMADLGED